MMLRALTLACLSWFLSSLVAAQAINTVQDVQTIVMKMVAARQKDRERIRPFTLKRDYQLFDQELQRKARLVASIVVTPPDHKMYEIQSGEGGRAEKILRNILARETQPSKDSSRQELSQQNYEFQLLGLEELNGRLCYKLAIRPRRHEEELIRGQIWVDSENYRVHRIEGQLAKSPSWWLHDLRVLIDFADVEGMWLRTFMHAIANVRFKGRYVVESRDVECHSMVDAFSLTKSPLPASYGIEKHR
jgi:hypothetical protein